MKITRTQLREMVQEQIKQMTEADDSFSKAGEEIEKKGTEGVGPFGHFLQPRSIDNQKELFGKNVAVSGGIVWTRQS